VKDREERLWHARAAIENGWSRNFLVIQIESGLTDGKERRTRIFRQRFLSHNPISRSNSSKTHTTLIS
jgi:hypothetical protein